MARNRTRREFVKDALGKAALIPLASYADFSFAEDTKQASASLNILILGGTSFLGPHQIAYALTRGHKITTFTRGKTKPSVHQDVFKEVTSLLGDREDNLEALKGKTWDVVIDNSGNRAHWVKKTADLLKDQADLYLFTSSTGVYYPYLGKDIKEDTPLLMKEPEKVEHEDEKLEYWFGVMKANAEQHSRNAFGADRSIIVRPTYMVGPADKLDRFIYWPVRLGRGGEIMVPGKAHDPVQFVDVRDVAQWMIRLVEQKAAGVYNAVGPASPMGMHAFMYGAHAAFNTPVSWQMIDDYEFLKKHKVPYIVPWIMPEGKNQGSALVNNQFAIQHGLRFTPLAQTVRDTYTWWYSDALTEERRQKFEAKKDSILLREAEIIKAWKAKK
ncbi:MAG: NAD-dependent epimerase/dehydratase family protein [Bacteroidota bacterium]